MPDSYIPARNKLASAISEVFSPFVLVGLLLVLVASVFDSQPLPTASVLLAFIVLIPQALALWLAYTKRTTDHFIVRREQRHRFYALSAASMLGGVIAAWVISEAWEIRYASCFALGILVIVALVNTVFKISVHSLAASFVAFCAPLIIGHPWLLLILIPISLIIPWARAAQQRHTNLEVILGYLLGVILAIIFIFFLYR